MPSIMQSEVRQAPRVVADLLAADADAYARLAADWRARPPTHIVTVARGTSDFAAMHFGYLVMARLGHIVTSLPMSLFTLERSPLDCAALTCLAWSQSGRSPDLLLPTQTIRAGGGRTVAIVNALDSPLAAAAETVLPLHAGPERSVAATKSLVAQLVVGVRLLAAWADDAELAAAIHALPARMAAALAADWSAALPVIQDADQLFVVGRGAGLAMAAEAALKCKEVVGLPAEAFSGAEVRHGPMTLIGAGFPLLVLAPRGAAQAGLIDFAVEMAGRGAQVLLAATEGTVVPATSNLLRLPLVAAPRPELDGICAILGVYLLLEAAARARGRDPDHPPHLSKVTCTL